MPSGLHTWSATAATNATADSAINQAEGMAPSAVNDSARATMAVVAKWRDDNNGSLATSGTSTAFTITSNTVFTTLALMDNATLAFIPHTTSGATPTLNVDGLGAKVIRNATGVALPTGALLGGSVYRATYDHGNGEWLVHNQQPVILAANAVTTTSITDANVTYAKIQNVSATARLLGRTTAGAGVIEEVSLASGLSFVGSVLTPGISQVLVPNYLSGLTLSTAGSSATMSIAAGVANDSTNVNLMSLTAIAKTTSSWAVGTGNGGLDTGSIATSTWYHFYTIKRTDTGVVDVLFSLSASSPTMPTNYTLFRRIGSGKTNGSSQWTSFTQTGDEFIWAAQVTDVSAIATTASRVSKTLTVPTGVVVKAYFRAGMSVSGDTGIIFTSLQENDLAPNATGGANDMAVDADAGDGDDEIIGGSFERLTNTSAQIGVRASGTSATYTISTYGWVDRRGKDG